MARSIASALTQIKSTVSAHITPDDIVTACAEAGHAWRERVLDPVTTVYALLLQVLHAVAMTGVDRLVGVRFSASAYCQALRRLPVDVMRRLLRSTATRQRAATDQVSRWRGLRTFLVDGSSCSMPDTPALQQRFDQPTEQKPGCGFPVAHLLALFDAYTGMLVDVLASSWRTHDLTRVGELHPHLGHGDLLVGDRGFCSYAHLATLWQRGIHAVLRMNQNRRVSFAAGQFWWADRTWPVRLGPDDQLMIWHKPKAPSRVMPRDDYDALPDTMIVRELRYRVSRPGFRTRAVTLVTTLLDPQAYPAAALAELYQCRWRAESHLRHLKDTLGMRVLRAKSAAGAERELLAFAIVYNLICAMLTIIAEHLETEPERVSFTDLLRLLRHGLDRLEAAAVVINPDRPGRVEPRLVKRRPLQYSRMTRPRTELKQELLKTRGP